MSTHYQLYCTDCDEAHTWERAGSAALDWLLRVRDARHEIAGAWIVLSDAAPSDSHGFDLYDANGHRFDAEWLVIHRDHEVSVRDEYGHHC